MKRNTIEYPNIKLIKPIFWKKCKFCGKEFKRETGYKIEDLTVINQLFEVSYCCNDCCKNIDEVKDKVKKSKILGPRPDIPGNKNKIIKECGILTIENAERCIIKYKYTKIVSNIIKEYIRISSEQIELDFLDTRSTYNEEKMTITINSSIDNLSGIINDIILMDIKLKFMNMEKNELKLYTEILSEYLIKENPEIKFIANEKLEEKDVIIVEFREKTNLGNSANLAYLANSYKEAEDWMLNNKDYDSGDNWWWAVYLQTINRDITEMHEDKYQTLLFYNKNGEKILNQPY